jgi:hypothetical protein
MFMLVVTAFLSTGVAHFCAKLFYFIGKFRLRTNHGVSESADFGAVAVQFNAACKHFYVLFLQAGRVAVIACFDALA